MVLLTVKTGGTDICALLSVSVGFDSVMALILLSAAAVLILKSFGFRGAPLVTVLLGVTLLSEYTELFGEISSVFSSLESAENVSEYVSAALKVVGISYLSGISADICREIGETGAAKIISVVTRLELVLFSLPYVKEILSSLLSLLGT